MTDRLIVTDLAALDVTRIGGPARIGTAAEGTLTVAPLVGEGVALGAFQRARSTLDLAKLEGSGLSLVRRATGGPALRVGRGQIHLSLSLSRPEAFGGVADPNRALNRHVRPLLRALEAIGKPTTFGGRDILLMGASPIAWVGLGHRVADRSTTLEAIVSVRTPFGLPTDLDLAYGAIAPRFLGRAPSTLEGVLGREIDASAVVSAIVAAYGLAASETQRAEAPTLAMTRVDADEPPFTAMVEEAIGLLGVRRDGDRLTFGGDLFASTDALDRLGLTLARASTDEAVDEAFEGAMLMGVKDRGAFVRLARAV